MIRRAWAAIDNRFLAPILVTCVLLAAHLSFGILETWNRTAIAILTAIAAEIVLGRACYGKWPHLASAYITGISVGMLIRSPLVWPFVLGSLLSIASKYVLRVRDRHLWNPSNFGICTMLVLAPATIAVLSVQWGNQVWPMIEVWVLGGVILWRLKRLHICAAYAAAFTLFAVVRSALTGNPLLAALAPITGPMYQLFIFFMITDPRTTVASRRGQLLVVVIVAAVEAVLRLRDVVYAPLFALFIVGPSALACELWLAQRQSLQRLDTIAEGRETCSKA
jgi:Na+-translocating ferredoxin:NAD+ oxidoreductase RnfD subunit